jgi:uncharacterized protein YcnI
MADRPKYFSRLLTTFVTAVLATLIGLLALATPAQARVSIVPGAVSGGGTETFAFRLANERTDTNSNRLELTFPQEPLIAYAEVAPVSGWTATITPRKLATPVQAGDKTISEVVGSIVLEGGSVGPRQFDQFLITLGPLPNDGKLAFEAIQTYTNGRTETWSGATAPTITVGPGNVAGVPATPTAANQGGSPDSGLAEQQAPAAESSGSTPALALLWGALGLAVVIIAVVGIRARLRRGRAAAPDADAEAETGPEEAVDTEPAEVAHK